MVIVALDTEQWEEYWAHGAPSRSERDHIIRTFLPLSRAIARKLKASLPASVDYDDLVSAGVIGLIAAVDRFDPDKGYNFKRYAAIRIRGAMLDELRQMDWAPRSVRRDEGQLSQTRKQLEHELGRRVSHEELADRLGMDSDKFARLVHRLKPQRVIRFDDMGSGGDSESQSGLNFIADAASPDPLQENELKEAHRVLGETVEGLRNRLRQVITFYYFDDLNLKEIAAIFSVTESRISQIHGEALGVLKKRLSDAV